MEEIEKEIQALKQVLDELPAEEKLSLLQELNRLVEKANQATDKLVK